MKVTYTDNPRSDRAKNPFAVRWRRGCRAWILAGAMSGLLIGGCQGGGAAGAGARSASASAGTGDRSVEGSWGLVLEYFTGEGHAERAALRSEAIKRQFGRQDVRVRDKRDASVIVLGEYSGPDDREARRDMAWVHGLEVDGRRPWQMAYLSPPSARSLGDPNEANLAFARDFFGQEAEFTLQIGVYQSPDSDEARRAAELAVEQLRGRGEEAFYYHGPSWSSVTIGLFGAADYDEARGEVLNGEILELQARYPRNLLNGQYPIKDKNTGQAQKSLLVHVP